ncbi:serine/threonine-protein kinase [Streptomyces sp. NPDC051907]|uniref:serine/threonine-protein kinase n=1 Tax=Streptomyces sp. NPDC051907 TaxID=3155284 RepID=UPI0034412002
MIPLGTGDPLRLGPYRLHGVLGEGGMGKVYFGQDNTGRTAAVKVLRPELAHDQHLAQRFVREAQMAQAVTSKGVAQVYGAQTEGGRPWIAAEFLAGPTLDQAVDTYGPMDDPTVRALANALAQTLHDIHAAGLVHRDLKPSNIVLTSAGPRIIDFGIARPEHGLTLTTTGQIPVTPGYGAPEQILGQRVGPPADVFSLGAVLAYAASGHRAYNADHIAGVQYEVVHGQPDLTHVPPALQTLIAPCLAKDAAHRPTPTQIGAAFAPPKGAERVWRRGPLADDIKARETGVRELTTQTGASANASTNPGTTTASGVSVSRRRLLTTLAAGGTVLAAGGGAGAWWLTRDGSDGSSKADDKAAAPGPFDIPKAVPTPKAKVGAFDASGKLKPLWGPLAVNSAETPPPKVVRDVIVFGARNGGIAAHSVVDGKQRWAAPEVVLSGGYVSVTDQLIAAVGPGGKLVTFVASTGERKWTAPAEAASVLAADDEAVYVATKDGRLRSIGRSDAKIRWTADSPVEALTEDRPRALSAKGLLLITGANGKVAAVKAKDGSKVWEFATGATSAITPAVDGDTVYLGGTNLTARRLSNGKEIWKTKPHRDYEGTLEGWSTPRVDEDWVYAMRGRHPQRVQKSDGKVLWKQPALGDFRSSVIKQGSLAWFLDDLPSVVGVEIGGGRSVSIYNPDEIKPPRGFAADGNRVFLTTEASITALAVI